MHISLVDDDPLYSKVLENQLRSEFQEAKIQAFSNGEACIHTMEQEPDVVLLDYKLDSRLPYAWDGLQVLKRIKRLDPFTHVILLSSHDHVETALECINEGALDYIIKNEKSFDKIKTLLREIQADISDNEEGKESSQYNARMISLIIILICLILIFFRS
jgi:two-component system OmpR family response regulator